MKRIYSNEVYATAAQVWVAGINFLHTVDDTDRGHLEVMITERGVSMRDRFGDVGVAVPVADIMAWKDEQPK